MMFSLHNIALFFGLFAVQPASAQDTAAEFRYLSHAVRDRLPSSDEARAFYAEPDKTQALDEALQAWLASPDHERRIERYFHDMFGSMPWVFVSEPSLDLIPYDPAAHAEAPSDLATAGVYYLPSTVKPTCGTPVTTTAWWTEEPVKVCATALSAAIFFDGGAVYCPDPFSANGIRNVKCGCGPEQILCYPRPQKGQVVGGIVKEFAARGWHAYETGQSWLGLLGGETFYGDRWLYHHYLYQERVVAKGETPTAAELAVLRSLPTDGTKTEVAFPDAGPERAGVVTAPAFLRRFNNFRSRVRALTERLLCKDIDGTLNTDGIQTFVNDDLSAFDKAHGTKESCATCHFGMDNLGSTLLGWSADGFFEAFPAVKSQEGHAFGVPGSGPRFLMESYVLRAAGFNECMAKRAFEDFSGISWAALAEADRTALTAAAADGPRATIRAVLTSKVVKEARLKKALAADGTVAQAIVFDTDVAPILVRSCSGADCHDAGNARSAGSAYVGDGTLFKGAPAQRISSGSMPPAGSGKSLNDAERALLVRYIEQQ